jgi:hypothetical protein
MNAANGDSRRACFFLEALEVAYSAERLAALTDAELKALAANVRRLSVSGTAAQIEEALRLTPMIEHEESTRRANRPPPRVGKGAARKPKE